MIHRILVGVVAALAVAVTVAMVLLAGGGSPAVDRSPGNLPLEDATLLEVEPVPADDSRSLAAGEVEVTITARLDASGEVIELLPVVDPNGATFRAGQRVRVEPLVGEGPVTYSIYDFRREVPLAILAVAFCLVVVAFGRFQGLRALIGLAMTALVVVAFLIPAILAGREPVVVALTAAFAIMLLTLYLSHGVSPKTTAAVVGTTLALLLTAGLSLLFVELAQVTGLSDEDALLANLGSAGGLSLRGLLLAGIVLGGLGVLDDVTVSQSSLVFQLAEADRRAGFGTLVRRALRVGRDHVAASVNTLFLAYAGASLPLLILFATGMDSVVVVLTSEVVAVEIVRTLVGSIGLIAAVPLTTALAATLVLSEREAPLAMPGRSAAGARERAERERGRPEPVRSGGGPVTIPGSLALEAGWSPPQEGAATRPERPVAQPAARRQRARPRPADETPPGQPIPLGRTVSPRDAPAADDPPRRRSSREERPPREERSPSEGRQDRPRRQDQPERVDRTQVGPDRDLPPDLPPDGLPAAPRPRRRQAPEDVPVPALRGPGAAAGDAPAPRPRRREAPETVPVPSARGRAPAPEPEDAPVPSARGREAAPEDAPVPLARGREAAPGDAPVPVPAVRGRRAEVPGERAPAETVAPRGSGRWEQTADRTAPAAPAARRDPEPATEQIPRVPGAREGLAPAARREPGPMERGATAAGAARDEAPPRYDPAPAAQERRPAERALVEPRPGERPAPTERLPLTRRPDAASRPLPDEAPPPRSGGPAEGAPADPPVVVGRAGEGRRRARPAADVPSPPRTGAAGEEDRPSRRANRAQPPAAQEGRRARREPPPPPAAAPDANSRRTRGRGDGSPKPAEPAKGRRSRPRTALDAEQEQLEAWLKQMRNPYGRAEDADGGVA